MRSACMNSTRESGLGTTNTPSSSTIFGNTVRNLGLSEQDYAGKRIICSLLCHIMPEFIGQRVLTRIRSNKPSTSMRRASAPEEAGAS